MAAEIFPENLPDEMLVGLAILGDLHSFDVLAMRYRAAVFRVAQVHANQELAEDIVQEALLIAFKALPTIEEPAKFASWLYAITRHVAMRRSQQARKGSLAAKKAWGSLGKSQQFSGWQEKLGRKSSAVGRVAVNCHCPRPRSYVKLVQIKVRWRQR